MYFLLVSLVPEAVQDLKVDYPTLPPPSQDGEPAIVDVTVSWKVRDNNSFYQNAGIKLFIVIYIYIYIYKQNASHCTRTCLL